MTIDRQRISAVRLLEQLGYTWRSGAWQTPPGSPTAHGSLPSLIAAADGMHDELTGQIDELTGCVEGSPEEFELQRLVDLVQAYESARPRD